MRAGTTAGRLIAVAAEVDGPAPGSTHRTGRHDPLEPPRQSVDQLGVGASAREPLKVLAGRLAVKWSGRIVFSRHQGETTAAARADCETGWWSEPGSRHGV